MKRFLKLFGIAVIGLIVMIALMSDPKIRKDMEEVKESIDNGSAFAYTPLTDKLVKGVMDNCPSCTKEDAHASVVKMVNDMLIGFYGVKNPNTNPDPVALEAMLTTLNK